MTNTTTGAVTALRELAERHGIVLLCDSQAALPPALRTLHQEILTAFIDTGRVPITSHPPRPSTPRSSRVPPMPTMIATGNTWASSTTSTATARA
jgi:hypothetical protein